MPSASTEADEVERDKRMVAAVSARRISKGKLR
jgi:hypothetical protein